MQRKRAIIIIVIAAIVAVTLASYYLFFNREDQFSGGSAMQAISSNTPMVVRVSNTTKLVTTLNHNSIWEVIANMPQVQEFNKEIIQIDSLQKSNAEQWSTIAGNELYITFNVDAGNEINTLYLMELRGKDGADFLSSLANEICSKNRWQIYERKYQHTTIFEATNPQNGQKMLSWAVKNGVAMACAKSIFIEDAIRESDNTEKLQDEQFEKIKKTVGQQSDMNIFVNHKYIEKIISKATSNEQKGFLSSLKKMSQWSELDINLHDENLSISGFSAASPNEYYLENVWLQQSPGQVKIETALPYSTAWYLSYFISDMPRFLADYKEFLSFNNMRNERNNQLTKISNLTKTNTEEFFADIISNEIAMVEIPTADVNQPWGQGLVMKVKSGRNAIDEMRNWQVTYLESLRLPSEGWSYEYKVDNTTVYDVYKNPFPELPSILFGSAFDSLNANYFTVHENFLIFANSPETMSLIVKANVLGETLDGNPDYNKFQASLTSKSNINFYCNTNISLPLTNKIFNKQIAESIKSNRNIWKFKMFGWQVVASGDMLYNNASLLFSESIKSKPQTIWKSHLETTSNFKPQFVKNHNDPQNLEIMVQDELFNLYLMNNVGRIVWKIKLDSKIIGEIKQVDCLKNGKLQYLFNTENKLHIIDRNGNYLNGFPVNLRGKATNGISVFDYDNNLNYRIFVACNDKKIYVYETSGNLVDGWNLFQTDHEVTQSIKHFVIEGKDFIVAADEMKDYIMNRKGEIRVATTSVYHHSNNSIFLEENSNQQKTRFITTDNNGAIHYTYIDGTHETVKLKDFPSQHYFVATNIDGDDNFEYIYAYDNIVEIFDDNQTPILSKKFDNKISHTPNIYQFSKTDKKIGVVTQSSSQIFLLNTDGSFHEGFPLVGISQFSIGFIGGSNNKFNLLVGGPDNYVYNYFIE